MEIESSSQQYHHLPEAIIAQILSRSPVKSLLRFRCVSKSWGSLIGCQHFIKMHLQNSIKTPSFPQKRVLIRKYEDGMFDISEMFNWPRPEQCFMCEIDTLHWPRQCSLLSVLSEPTNTIPLSPFVDPKNTTFCKGYQILGCSNGLLCVLDTSNRIHLWNPSTRISKKLPEISIMGSRVRKLGFGWVESSGEYKVFVVVETNRKLVGKVYGSKTKSWKTIEICDYLYACRPRGLFAGGKLYWYNGCIIIFLDLKSEVFGRIEIPYKDIGFKMDYFVGVLGGCLCVLYYNPSFPDRRGLRVSRVCVMKEAWEEVVTLSHLNELLQPPLVSLNGEILVDCGSTLLVYNARDNVFRFTKVSSGLRSYVYVESLVSPEDV